MSTSLPTRLRGNTGFLGPIDRWLCKVMVWLGTQVSDVAIWDTNGDTITLDFSMADLRQCRPGLGPARLCLQCESGPPPHYVDNLVVIPEPSQTAGVIGLIAPCRDSLCPSPSQQIAVARGSIGIWGAAFEAALNKTSRFLFAEGRSENRLVDFFWVPLRFFLQTERFLTGTVSENRELNVQSCRISQNRRAHQASP